MKSYKKCLIVFKEIVISAMAERKKEFPSLLGELFFLCSDYHWMTEMTEEVKGFRGCFSQRRYNISIISVQVSIQNKLLHRFTLASFFIKIA